MAAEINAIWLHWCVLDPQHPEFYHSPDEWGLYLLGEAETPSLNKIEDIRETLGEPVQGVLGSMYELKIEGQWVLHQFSGWEIVIAVRKKK